MIELKRLKLINWHNFENVTFDCARLTYMIGVNAVGKTTILDAIRYCLTTNRSFNALGNKKSGRTLQGSVHAKQRGENAYRRPGRTVAYIGAEFWDSVKRTHFVIAVRVESEGPMQELHPGDQTWYISEDGCTLEQLPFIDPRTGAPSSKENFKPAVGRLSYTRSPGEARDRICRALGIGRAASPLGKKFNEVFQMGTSMDEIPNFREFLYQYILPQPELDLEALQGDRVELENLHAVLAEAQTRAAALEQIVDYGREAAQKETEALVNRGTPYIYEGEELGMTNAHFTTLEQYRDLESINAYRQRVEEAKCQSAESMMAALALIGRDNARTPMQWDASRYAGFTAPDAATEPWIGVNPNHVEINAAEEFDDPESVYSFYKKLIAMRHNNATIATGEWNLVAADSEQVYSFTRTSGDDTILVIVNLTDRTAQVPAEVAQLLEDGVGESQVLLSTYDAVHSVKSVARGELARWEGVVIQL